MEMKPVHKSEVGARFKRTPQRLAILEYLEGNTSHPSADEIFKVVSKRHQSMSFATVYNTLHTLTRAGALRELTIDPARKRYDPDTSSHHHFLCISCNAIADVSGAVTVNVPGETLQDAVIVGNHVEFYGYCAACRKKKKNL
jgi:Fur family peroxide stress response transcriptional regulator